MNDMNLKLVDSEDEKKEKDKKVKKTDSELKRKMLKYAVFIVIAVGIFLLVLFIISLFFSPKKSYVQVEEIMKKAAQQYYSEHKNRLPGDNTKNAGIEASTLISNEYMKEFSEYFGEDTKCNSGRVTVEKVDNKFVYTPYLYCGNEYETSELYKKVVEKKKIVVNGDGLYFLNDEYVFRGTNVKNYVLLDDWLWRIVKIDKNNEALLIKDSRDKTLSVVWDDRYNNIRTYKAGINDFKLSRLKDSLKDYYKSDKKYYYGKGKILSDSTKEKLVPFDLCVGKRATDYVANNNSAECGQTVNNQMIGLLTMSDYLNASTDPECISPLGKTCQNYNYLASNYGWWLITADSSDTYTVFRVVNGIIEKSNASNMAYLRPTIKLSSRAMFKSGSGTEKDPYIIR